VRMQAVVKAIRDLLPKLEEDLKALHKAFAKANQLPILPFELPHAKRHRQKRDTKKRLGDRRPKRRHHRRFKAPSCSIQRICARQPRIPSVAHTGAWLGSATERSLRTAQATTGGPICYLFAPARMRHRLNKIALIKHY
jgi:hypothetical protein